MTMVSSLWDSFTSFKTTIYYSRNEEGGTFDLMIFTQVSDLCIITQKVTLLFGR
jgi:hypothetical protein